MSFCSTCTYLQMRFFIMLLFFMTMSGSFRTHVCNLCLHAFCGSWAYLVHHHSFLAVRIIFSLPSCLHSCTLLFGATRHLLWLIGHFLSLTPFWWSGKFLQLLGFSRLFSFRLWHFAWVQNGVAFFGACHHRYPWPIEVRFCFDVLLFGSCVGKSWTWIKRDT